MEKIWLKKNIYIYIYFSKFDFFFLIHNSVNFHCTDPRQLLSSFSLSSPLEKKNSTKKIYAYIFIFIFYKNIYIAIINKVIETD